MPEVKIIGGGNMIFITFLTRQQIGRLIIRNLVCLSNHI